MGFGLAGRMAVSVIRKFLLWWFDEPYSPWVSTSAVVDFRAAQLYLEEMAKKEGPKVSIQHLICASVSRALMAIPEANARIIGQKIYPQEHVGIGMPINLLGHRAGKTRELSMSIVPKVDTMTLRELAAATHRVVKEEREGKVGNPFLKNMLIMADLLPQRVTNRMLNRLDRLMNNPVFAQKIYDMLPVTTGVTNPGATLPSDIEGILFRGAAINLPNRLLHLGTLWGVSSIQKEVLPIDGVPTICPVLPIMMVFDHRLIDGVKASRLMLRFGEIIRNPEAEFGPPE